MKNKLMLNLLMFLLLTALLFLTGLITAFPWWAFAVPIFFAGAVLSWYNISVPAFIIGFLAGFTVWFGYNFTGDVSGGGIVFEKMAGLLYAGRFAVLAISGIIGGLVTGLAFYSGKLVFSDKIAKAVF